MSSEQTWVNDDGWILEGTEWAPLSNFKYAIEYRKLRPKWTKNDKKNEEYKRARISQFPDCLDEQGLTNLGASHSERHLLPVVLNIFPASLSTATL